MKYLLLLLLFSFEVFADCTVTEKKDEIVLVSCENYLGQTTLFDTNSHEYIVIKNEAG